MIKENFHADIPVEQNGDTGNLNTPVNKVFRQAETIVQALFFNRIMV